MSDPEDTKTKKAWLESWLTRVTGIVILVGGLLASLDPILESDVFALLMSFFKEEDASMNVRDCVKEWEFVYPEETSVSNWSSMKLVLKGKNECKTTLQVHIAFKIQDSAHVRIDPIFDSRFCKEPTLANADCWQEKTFDVGNVYWEVSPPKLISLKSPLPESEEIRIDWSVYNADTGVRLRSGDVAKIRLSEDT